MSTRKAKDDSVYHQNRYASSPEFERGLIANLVARRCEVLGDKAERELIWFIQYLSHRPGGVAAMAAEIIARFGNRLGTPTMMKSGCEIYQAEEVRKIREELPPMLRRRFPLRGESPDDIRRVCGGPPLPGMVYELRKLYEEEAGYAAAEAREREETAGHPSSYPAAALLALCREAATTGFDDKNDTDNLETELCNLCLDPGWNLTSGCPWYFAGLVNVLGEYRRQWIAENSGAFVTTLGRKVCETLDYTLYGRRLALLEGNARLGKSFAARAWCLQHPGLARFVEVPPGNDDTSFFRALARGLGLGNFLKYKTIDIRERVESVLLTGDLLLVLDEAHRLWPERNFRYAYPSRITWLMALANAGVPICMITTPQFIQAQKVAEKAGWNSAQLTGRIGHYEQLPSKLSESDIIAVAKAILPEASEDVLLALADYASESSRYLAAVETIATRARYIARMNGRDECLAADVRTAMKESVIPSDTMLVRTLDHAQKPAGRKLEPVSADLAAPVEIGLAARRNLVAHLINA